MLCGTYFAEVWFGVVEFTSKTLTAIYDKKFSDLRTMLAGSTLKGAPQRAPETGGELDEFPPRNHFSSIFASFCPIKLKIELHTDQPFSYRFPECFCDLKIFATPLAHFSSQGGPKRDKSSQNT